MSRVLRGFAAVAMTIVSLGVAATPAAAHSHFMGTDPRAGSTLDRAPQYVMLRFSEPVDLAPDTIVVTRDGQRVQTDPAQLAEGGKAVYAALRGEAQEGAYRVEWRIVSEDDHVESGSFGYTVRFVPAPSSDPALVPAVEPEAAADPEAATAGAAPAAPLPAAGPASPALSTAPVTVMTVAPPLAAPAPASPSLAAAPAASPDAPSVGGTPIVVGLLAALGAMALAAYVLRRTPNPLDLQGQA